MSDHHIPPPAPGAEETHRLTRAPGAIHVTRSGIGISLQTGTLITLLGLGWQAKGALDENFRRLDSIEVRFEQKTEAIEKAMGQLELKVATAQVSAEQLVQLQIANANLRGDLTAALQRIKVLEDLATALQRIDALQDKRGRR